jgi:hypothetical protein
MTFDPFDPFNELAAETDPAVLTAGHEWVKQQFYEDDTMYFDFFLRFDTEAEANEVLFTEQTFVQGDIVETVKVPRYAAVDIIGTIFKPTGKTLMTEEGEVFEHAPIDGWHVNVRHTEAAPELEAFRVFPETPSRMWA